jgi:hypothetical protein
VVVKSTKSVYGVSLGHGIESRDAPCKFICHSTTLETAGSGLTVHSPEIISDVLFSFAKGHQ